MQGRAKAWLTAAGVVVGAVLAAPVARAATVKVTSNTDNGTGCTLREAIASVNGGANSGGCTHTGTYGTNDTIDATGISGTIATQSVLLTTNPVIINGPGQNALTIDGGGSHQVFGAATDITLSGLTITNGKASHGAGVYSQANLTLDHVTLTNNTATADFGGGAFAQMTLTVTDCTISGNTAASEGGGIYSNGNMLVTGSTVAGNAAGSASYGSGLFATGDLTLTSSTVSGNLKSVDAVVGGGCTLTNSTLADNTGTGLFCAGATMLRNSTVVGNSSVGVQTVTLTLTNSIVALNGQDCSMPPFTATASLASDGSCSAAGVTTVTKAQLALGPLADNGGPTETMALLSGSVAIDAGDTASCQAADQRGVPRPLGSGCDIGAYEAGAKLDLGDAPSTYPVLLADDGAAHELDATGPYLGATAPDAEDDGQPSALADGDDTTGTDDEDGLSTTVFPRGQTTQVTVTVNQVSGGAYLSAWFDKNADGDWDDSGEQIANDVDASSSPVTLNVKLPASAPVGPTFVRVRVCSTQGDCNTPRGIATDGEVEDTLVLIPCSGDSDCASNEYCDAAGKCRTQKAQGTACGADNQCATGHCADGACCDTACTGQCEACDVSGSTGTCSAVTGAPHGNRTACAGAGSACGGSCDGNNRTQCAYPGASTACGTPNCAAGAATTSACDGQGTCAAGTPVDCAPYACGATACKTSCSGNTDCASGYTCSNSACIAATDAGSDALADAGNDALADTGSDAAADAGNDAAGPPNSSANSGNKGGCACRAAGGEGDGGAPLALLLGLVVLGWRRRRE